MDLSYRSPKRRRTNSVISTAYYLLNNPPLDPASDEMEHTEVIYRGYIPQLMHLVFGDGPPTNSRSGEIMRDFDQIILYFCLENGITTDSIGRTWLEEWLTLALFLQRKKDPSDYLQELKLINPFLNPGLHFYGEDTLPTEWYSIPKLREYLFVRTLEKHLRKTKPFVDNIKLLREYTQTVRSDAFNVPFTLSYTTDEHLLFYCTIQGSEEWLTKGFIDVYKFFSIIEELTIERHIDPFNEHLVWFSGFAAKPSRFLEFSFSVLVHSQSSDVLKLALSQVSFVNQTSCSYSIGFELLEHDYSTLYHELIRNGCVTAALMYDGYSGSPAKNTVSRTVFYDHHSITEANIFSEDKYNSRTKDDVMSSYTRCRIAPYFKLAVSKLPLPDDAIYRISEFLWQVYTPDVLTRTLVQTYIRRTLNDLFDSAA